MSDWIRTHKPSHGWVVVFARPVHKMKTPRGGWPSRQSRAPVQGKIMNANQNGRERLLRAAKEELRFFDRREWLCNFIQEVEQP